MNLMDLFIKIGVDDQASSKVGSISKKIGNGLKTAAKIGTAAVAAAGTAVIALAKSSIDAYAEYEQLVGGAELMFGKAFDFVMEKSNEAYKNVQMSQNEYLQQMNGFATGLKTALNGDAQAAAELADKIITAEADIVAATGNSQEAVQNAFNGIMKSNYTMLDNLQIGITPTKEGFQEVIDKVNEWNKANGNATKYQIDNLADAQSALVDYIEMVGMSGYAQEEASKTLSGSISSMKASWENLKVAMVSDTGDIDKRINEFVESVGTVGENLLPRVKTVLSGVVSLVKGLAPQIIRELPILVQTLLPEVLSAAVSLVGLLADTLLNGGTAMLWDVGLDMIMMLLDGLLNALTDGEAVQKIVQLILDLAIKLTDPKTLVPILEAALDIILALVDGLIQAIPELIKAAPTIVWNLIASLLEFLPQLSLVGWDLLESLLSAFSIEDIKDYGKNIVEGIKKGILGAWDGIKKWFSGLLDGLFDVGTVFGKDNSNTKKSVYINGSHANGLSYVPYDGYIAELHRGERVLTSKEAKQYSSGIGGSSINITINGAKYNSEESLAEAVAYRIQQMINGKEAAYA
jgi:hypothetical protein